MVIPEDWMDHPAFLEHLKHQDAREWGLDLHRRWKSLARKFNHDNLCKMCYSSIPLPHPFMIPGGRFREMYYWDSNWIVRGLLVSGMTKSAKMMLENLAFLTEKYGFVPNGARIYYLNRSQPPFLVSNRKKVL